MPVKTKYEGAKQMANKDAVRKYQAAHDQIKIRPTDEEGAAIRAAAAAAGLSVQAYILQAIRAQMQREDREA